MLVTLVAYLLLPVRTLLAVLFGVMVAASHFIVTVTSVTGRKERIWRPVRHTDIDIILCYDQPLRPLLRHPPTRNTTLFLNREPHFIIIRPLLIYLRVSLKPLL